MNLMVGFYVNNSYEFFKYFFIALAVLVIVMGIVGASKTRGLEGTLVTERDYPERDNLIKFLLENNAVSKDNAIAVSEIPSDVIKGGLSSPASAFYKMVRMGFIKKVGNDKYYLSKSGLSLRRQLLQ